MSGLWTKTDNSTEMGNIRLLTICKKCGIINLYLVPFRYKSRDPFGVADRPCNGCQSNAHYFICRNTPKDFPTAKRCLLCKYKYLCGTDALDFSQATIIGSNLVYATYSLS
jgi:hypothetical protein